MGVITALQRFIKGAEDRIREFARTGQTGLSDRIQIVPTSQDRHSTRLAEEEQL